MLVEHADGWKVWGTIPASLIKAHRGDKVRFDTAITRSDRDPKFGFFSRPKYGRILEEAIHAD
jgi:hypothetical protein